MSGTIGVRPGLLAHAHICPAVCSPAYRAGADNCRAAAVTGAGANVAGIRAVGAGVVTRIGRILRAIQNTEQAT